MTFEIRFHADEPIRAREDVMPWIKAGDIIGWIGHIELVEVEARQRRNPVRG